MSQPSEKAYTPPGSVPPHVPGQYNHVQGQHEQYPQGQQPPPMTQYDRPPFSQAQLHNPSPQYQHPPTRQYTPPPQTQGPSQHQYQPYPQVQHAHVQQQQQQQPAAQYAYGHPQMAPPPQQQHQLPFQTMLVQHQPAPMAGMTTTTGTSGNRNVKNLPRNARGRREWSFDLCNCFDDCGTCLLGCFCPCMLYAQLKQRVDYLNAYGSPDPIRGGSGVNLNCLVWCALHLTTGCGCVLQAINRGNIRHRYMIEGDGFMDFCTAGWCPACELTQEHREIDQEELSLLR